MTKTTTINLKYKLGVIKNKIIITLLLLLLLNIYSEIMVILLLYKEQ